MKKLLLISTLVTLLAASFMLPVQFGGAGAASAASQAAPVYCNRVFLPSVLGGGAGASAAVAAPAAQVSNDLCDGFPDFNGDGYADLAIGVPQKEVSNGITNQVDVGIVHVIYGSNHGLDAGAGQLGPDDQIWHRQVGGVAANPDDRYGAALGMGDFDNDGYDDLAIGIPGANINAQDNAGAVAVIYGSAAGLDLFSIEEWSRFGDGLTGTAGAGDEFGASLTTGDFDGDGYADLAIGAPYDEVGGDAEAGSVQILYGRSTGLSGLGDELLTQDVAGFPATPAEPFDHFGLALAAGDFNGDGVDDLAVGTPGENNGDDYVDAGAVQIFMGDPGVTAFNSGLISNGTVNTPQHWTADSPDVEGAMEAEDGFGFSLAAANFNGDAYDDLAVGIPFEIHGSGGGALTFGGAINVFNGGPGGLTATPAWPARIWHQDVSGMADETEQAEFFGYALAAADFDNDGYADLAIGVPGDRTLGVDIGAVHLMFGTSIGLTAANDELLYDPDNPEADDSFGWTLSAGDYDGNGLVDLAVGAYRDDPVGVAASNPGSVFVFYSDADGLQITLNQNWWAGHFGLKGSTANNDYFGNALPGSPEKP